MLLIRNLFSWPQELYFLCNQFCFVVHILRSYSCASSKLKCDGSGSQRFLRRCSTTTFSVISLGDWDSVLLYYCLVSLVEQCIPIVTGKELSPGKAVQVLVSVYIAKLKRARGLFLVWRFMYNTTIKHQNFSNGSVTPKTVVRYEMLDSHQGCETGKIWC